MKKMIFVFIACICVCLVALLICLNFTGCSYVGMIYPDADKYSIGDAVITGKVEKIDIDWIAGSVAIDIHSEDSIKLTEASDKELSDDYRVHWYLDGTTLRIKYFKSGVDLKLSFNNEKQLALTVPKDLIADEIKINSASASIKANISQADRICVDTASGDIDISADKIAQLDIDSASGDIDVSADKIAQLDIVSASGKVNIDVTTLDSASIDTSSGAVFANVDSSDNLKIVSSSGKLEINGGNIKKLDTETSSGDVSVSIANTYDELEIDSSSGVVKLILPEEVGYRLDYETASGDFDNEFAVVINGETQTYGDGYARIGVETASGDLIVRKH